MTPTLSLGLGDTLDRLVPTKLPAPTAAPITAISLRGDNSAFLAGGELFMYGDNYYNQVGFPKPSSDAADRDVCVPTKVETRHGEL